MPSRESFGRKDIFRKAGEEKTGLFYTAPMLTACLYPFALVFFLDFIPFFRLPKSEERSFDSYISKEPPLTG